MLLQETPGNSLEQLTDGAIWIPSGNAATELRLHVGQDEKEVVKFTELFSERTLIHDSRKVLSNEVVQTLVTCTFAT